MDATLMSSRRQLLIGAFCAAASPSWAAAPETIKAVATFSILRDLVANVGGGRVAATSLVGPNGDVHVYSPTPADARQVAEAAVIVFNGLGLEGWLTRLVTASSTHAVVIVASAGVAPLRMEESGQSVIDPHAWQSIANARIYVGNIRDGLVKADPAGRAAYEANAKTYVAKLDALEGEVKAAIARIPAERRKIITTHDAFGYFGAAYGIDFISPEGVSTEAEPSAHDLAQIISQIRRQKIPAVFLENVTDPRMMRQLARETGATIGGTLYSDALSGPDGPAATYIDMMRSNVRELTAALIG
jgi:zinc/manganese transport system substrate-binding protein